MAVQGIGRSNPGLWLFLPTWLHGPDHPGITHIRWRWPLLSKGAVAVEPYILGERPR